VDDQTAEELRTLRASIREAAAQHVKAQHEVAEALRGAMAARSSSVAIADAGAAASWHRATAASNARTAIIILTPILVGWALWLGLENRELRARIDVIEQAQAKAATIPSHQTDQDCHP